MRKSNLNKRLTYVVNILNADDTQHFVHIPNLLSEMRQLGWDVQVFSERGGEGLHEVQGVPVRYLSRVGRWSRLPRLARELLRMRAHGGRLVFVRISKSAALVSAILGRLFGWKTLFWLSGAVEDFNSKHGGMRSKLDFAGLWILFRLVDRLVTGPEAMVSYYAGIYRLPAHKIVMLYNDIDLKKVEPLAANDTKDTAHILLVHRLSPVRETGRYFPDLIGQLNDYCSLGKRIVLDVVGDGPERRQLEKLAESASCGLMVRFHGAIPNRELGKYYNQAALFVMPSYREGFPRVILEAMARGLPMVSTDAGGTRNLVGALQGKYIVDRDDAETFASKVIELLSAVDICASLTAENLLTVQRYSTPVVAAKYDDALVSLLPEYKHG